MVKVTGPRKCAFCGAKDNLTNEHLFPQFLSHSNDSGQMISVANTPKGDKAVAAQLTIGDVCSGCNNGVLAELDRYVSELHEKYFRTMVRAGDHVRFAIDYDRLLRWLLKVGYNFARARGWIVSEKSDIPEYVLGKIPRPSGFRVFVQLIIPTPTNSIKWDQRPEADEIPPATARVELLDLQSLPGFSMAFKISLNSYTFYVFKNKEQTSVPARIRERVLAAFIKLTAGAYEITEKQSATVYASSLDFLSSVSGNAPFERHLQMMKKHKDTLQKRATGRKRKPSH